MDGCLYICTNVCIYVCMYGHMYVCMYVCTYICLYVCIYVCKYVFTCVCMHKCIYVHMYVCMYVCMYVRMYIVCMYVCMSLMILFCRNPSLSAGNTWAADYWPLHTPLKRETLLLNADKSETLEGNRVKRCAFWRKFLPQLGDYLFITDTSILTKVGLLICSFPFRVDQIYRSFGFISFGQSQKQSGFRSRTRSRWLLYFLLKSEPEVAKGRSRSQN